MLPAYRMRNGSATSRHRQTKASQSLPRSKEISGSRPATRADKGAAEKTGSVNFRLGSRSIFVDLRTVRSQYLLVDGHSIIFAWPELRALHQRRTSLARDALVKRLRDYQDWTGVRVVVVFDGRGPQVTESGDPGEAQIFYSRAGQTADAVIERLASKYATQFSLLVATADSLEQQTVSASGAQWISPEALRELLDEARSQ